VDISQSLAVSSSSFPQQVGANFHELPDARPLEWQLLFVRCSSSAFRKERRVDVASIGGRAAREWSIAPLFAIVSRRGSARMRLRKSRSNRLGIESAAPEAG
jgi:hypothetical protein